MRKGAFGSIWIFQGQGLGSNAFLTAMAISPSCETSSALFPNTHRPRKASRFPVGALGKGREDGQETRGTSGSHQGQGN